MNETNPFTELLRPHVKALQQASFAGDVKATEVIRLYQMHCSCPSDPGAIGIGMAAAEAWLKEQGLWK